MDFMKSERNDQLSNHTEIRANEDTKINNGNTEIKKDDGNNHHPILRSEHGLDKYPERRGEKLRPSLLQVLTGKGRYSAEKYNCEQNVYSCVQNSPLVKLMLSALKSSGCEVDIRRHISCERCVADVAGGFDPELNQVVVCENLGPTEETVAGILGHEFVHMFDYCRANLDFKNLDHLACTEVRAANLIHCSFFSSVSIGTSSPINIAKTHGDCVKKRAVTSILATRNVSFEEAKAAVDRVFDKCYNDLEPVGRRIRRNSYDVEKAYRERYHYDYYD